MFTPTMGKLGINFVANECYTLFTSPKSKSFHVSVLKHATSGIAG